MATVSMIVAFDLRSFNMNALFPGNNVGIGGTIELMGTSYAQDLYYITSGNAENGFVTSSFDLLGSGLGIDATTSLPTTGTVNAVSTWFLEGQSYLYQTAITGFSLPATDFASVMATPSNADDLRLIARILGTGDTVNLSVYNDWFDSGAGNDTMNGGGGNDTMLGNAGNDRLTGGSEDDSLMGGNNNDRLTGGTGADSLLGGAGNDTLIGQADRTVDHFIFNRAAGDDQIIGFEDGVDRIVITDGATRFSDLRITDKGADVLVSFADTEITLKNISHLAITKADFLFT